MFSFKLFMSSESIFIIEISKQNQKQGEQHRKYFLT